MEWIRVLLFLVLAGAAGYYSLTAFYKRYQFLMLGAQEDRFDNKESRISGFFKYVLGQGKVLAEPSGIAHFIIFYGFIIISIGAMDFFVYHLTGGHHIPGLGSDVFVAMHEGANILVLVALAIAAVRRYILKPMRLDVTMEAGLIVGMIAALILSDFLYWGTADAQLGHEPGFIAPVAGWLATKFSGLSDTALTVMKEIFFWFHSIILLYFAVFIPRSKHLHMVGAMFNVYFRKTDGRPVGRLKKLDLEDESIEEFGVGRVDQWSWKQLLDGYACTECGRCHVNCPATISGTPLSPKYLILKMKDHLIDVGDNLLAQKQASAANGEAAVELAATAEELPMLIGDVYSEEEIWACTTCRACEEACPVFNEHVDKIIDMRRWLVLTEGKAEPEVNRMFQNLERQSNEWGQSRSTRGDWAKGLDIPTMGDVEGEVEWLFYVGSSASFDVRNQKIVQSFAKLLKEAGVSFAILGAEEESDGDSARRLGNEFLYQSLVEGNIEIFKEYGVKKIVTTCPHAYNTFKHEYPDFGWEAEEILHHSEMLAQLMDAGKLKPNYEVDQLITYHDSCYLGRYNGVYSAPRYILGQIPGLKLVEMERNMGKSMCCGAGGGGLFKEDTGAERINVIRTEQALETGATAISTACPYCMTMLTDGTKGKEVEDTMSVHDVAELLAMSVFGNAKQQEVTN
ncbi:MAG TPA: (Fe-S)-binding protein [Bacilli bacterium]|nr:(Fe-S)-binding protein [Bacilli bacterium]